MATALSIVVGIFLLGVVIYFATRKRGSALPPEAHTPSAPPLQRETGETHARAAQTAKPAEDGKPIAADAGAPQVAKPGVGASLEPVAKPAPAIATQAPVATTATLPAAPEPSADASIASAAREQDVAAIKKGLAGTRGGFIAKLAKLFTGKSEIDKGLLEEIEELLIGADLGVRTTERILSDLRAKMQAGQLRDEQSVWTSIRTQAEAILDVGAPAITLQRKPAVILVIGVNGVGKTTTIGKLACRYVAEGKKVLLAAGDTYRAAAVLQLEMWGKRVGCPVVKGKENADPGSVIFEAIRRAREESFDLVIADTAGRLHTKAPLMDELRKVERTVAKATDGASADEVFLVLDSTTGQNAVQQMKLFREAIGVTGVVLTKLDGTAKGGVVLGIVDQHQVPIRFIGLGERVEDLREFDAHTFVEALFAKPTEATLAA
jgi:fused signal recognition particle receptor